MGGTSAAAPLLAGGLALVDQSLRSHHRQDIGLANPLLYGIAHSSAGPGVISDVVANNNDLGQSLDGKALGCCTAGPGFDEASGLGSVNLAGLAFAAGALVPPIVNVSMSLPAQRHPVADKHVLARVSCSGHCLMGAFTRIKIGRSGKPITKYSNVYLLKKGGTERSRSGWTARPCRSCARAWPGVSGSPPPCTGRSSTPAATSRRARAARICASEGRAQVDRPARRVIVTSSGRTGPVIGAPRRLNPTMIRAIILVIQT